MRHKNLLRPLLLLGAVLLSAFLGSDGPPWP